MHSVVVAQKKTKRQKNRARSSGIRCNFMEGDFVLWSRIDPRLSDTKLIVRWVGPFMVTDVKEHSYEIQHLLTHEKYDVHGSRLKKYADAAFGVTEELREHISLQGMVFGVRSVNGLRYNDAAGAWELLVSWIGFEDHETSWEPLMTMRMDVPRLVKEYLENNSNLSEVQRLMAAGL